MYIQFGLTKQLFIYICHKINWYTCINLHLFPHMSHEMYVSMNFEEHERYIYLYPIVLLNSVYKYYAA